MNAGRRVRPLLLAVALALVAAAPAHAVVGGKPVRAADVPWFASFAGCGGTLVAPDRILTAGHCVRFLTPAELQSIRVGGTTRRGLAFSMHPDWQRENAGNVLDDVAIIQLDRPVTDVTPATLGGPSAGPSRMTIIGRGASTAPRAGRRPGIGSNLRGATLRRMSDAQCRRAYRRARGNDGERFFAAQMVCGIDVNGRPPLSSGCVGDSGGPFYSGPDSAPVVHGVVSWGGDRCGADRLPSVFAEVRHYRGFITSPSPVWAPAPGGPVTITGTPRVGETLTCSVASWTNDPTDFQVLWQSQNGGRPRNVSRRATYTVRESDRGRRLVCAMSASNAGGPSAAPLSQASIVKIPR